jgi:hypothetical protein
MRCPDQTNPQTQKVDERLSRGDKNALKDSDHGCTTLNILKTAISYTLKK